jgi:ketopantoate reductase
MWLAPRSTVLLAPRALRKVSLCSAASGDHERGLRVGVVGLGAIGTIFFTQLSRVALQPALNGHRPLIQSVEAFVKPTHLAELIQQRRVALSHPQKENAPFTALGLNEADGGLESAGGTSRIQTLASGCREPRAPLDVVLLALKANDSARVIEDLQIHHAHRFRRDAVFVLLQNGLGAFPSQEAAANQIDTAYQYANGVTYVGGRMESMGHVVVSGMETEPTYFAPVNVKTTAAETQGQVARERLRVLSDALVQSGEGQLGLEDH